MTPTLKISSEQDGKRLDVILARQFRDHSRAFLQKWIREGNVTLGGEKLIPNYRVQAGETIQVANFESPAESALSRREKGTPHTIIAAGEGRTAPKVLFEDASLLVLNKPAHLVVHPAPSHQGYTLVDWLESYWGKK